MDHVEGDLERVVATDRARRGLDRVGRPDQLAGSHDGFAALQHHRHNRPRCDELDQVGVERLAFVLGVVLRGLLLADPQQLHAPDREPAALEASQDLTGQPAGVSIGFDHHERALEVGH